MKDKLVSIALSALIAFGLWMYVITEVSPNSEDTFLDIQKCLTKLHADFAALFHT